MKKLLYISNKPKDTAMLMDLSKNLEASGIAFHPLSLKANHYIQIEILEKIQAFSPDVILIHHNRMVMTRHFWSEARRFAPLVWWVNDERYPPASWMLTLSREVDLWLVASRDSAEWLQGTGDRAEYLIMGYLRQNRINTERNINLCFTGQNSGERFPLSVARRQMVRAVKAELGADFHIYGTGWGALANRGKISDRVYRRVKIGLSIGHYNTRGTFSNRMMSIMGHGALCLCHRTKGLEEVFTDGEHLVMFDDIDDLLLSYRYYLDHETERLAIAGAGRTFVEKFLTWSYKGYQIAGLLKKYRLI